MSEQGVAMSVQFARQARNAALFARHMLRKGYDPAFYKPMEERGWRQAKRWIQEARRTKETGQ